ncbi:MAG: CotH kinase family protein [Bacteroidia bacterium]|nr:CotH kinase family protein [Bacteroidia bacterium]
MKKVVLIILLFIISFWDLVQGQSINHWETAVFNNDLWRYFIGTSEPDANWRSLSFNDTGWTQGPGGFGYSDNDDNTVISPCTSVFIRCKFNVTDTASIARVLLSMDYDDAFVAYLNDVEIARAGITGVHPAYYQTGTNHEATMYQGGLPESFAIEKTQLNACLLLGENVLAIQVHNSSPTSSDMSSNAFLSFEITNTSNNYRPVPVWFSVSDDFTSSNLPIIIITTKPGEMIADAPKITADMKIIYNSGGMRNYVSDSGNVYTGKVGIEIRGFYSASLPQKPYGFETRDISGNNLNVSLLGMPPENDWVLLANYNDKTFLRNVLAFDIFRKMGNYATRSRFCEVVVNNEYQGIYLLGEKIKQDKGRVDIAKLTPEDNAGDNLTGGYIIKNDYYTAADSWMSRFSPLNKPGQKIYFVYYDPKPDVLTEKQKTYIQGYFNSLETVLYNPFFKSPVFGYKAYIDINSFADYFILGEVSRNVDTYKKSRYFYKDKNSKDSLLHSGPPWDFDWAWKNLTENCIHFNQTDGSGWAYKINECYASPIPPSWEIRMLQDRDFADLVYNRYFELRNTILSQAQIENTIDSVAYLIDEAQYRHFQKWNILGINVGTPEPDFQPTTYSGEIVKFKGWINTRLAWLDASVQINVTSFKPGIYIARIVFRNGEIATTTVVKK